MAATQKQKRLARIIVENATVDKPLNGGEMLEKVGYSANLVKQPGRVIQQAGVQEELALLGFDPDTAMRVVGKILVEGENEGFKLKAADMIFKVHGTYAAEKHVNLNVDVKEPSDRIKELAEKMRKAQGI